MSNNKEQILAAVELAKKYHKPESPMHVLLHGPGAFSLLEELRKDHKGYDEDWAYIHPVAQLGQDVNMENLARIFKNSTTVFINLDDCDYMVHNFLIGSMRGGPEKRRKGLVIASVTDFAECRKVYGGSLVTGFPMKFGVKGPSHG